MRPDRSAHASAGARAGALAALLAALAAAGCTGAPDLAPRPLGLAPGGGPGNASTPVTITGVGFFPRVVQSASGGPASLDTGHRAWLDALELTEVTWVDVRTLRATIPPGLARGAHTLTVENALGHRGALPAAWTVIEPAVLSLSATATPSTLGVGQPVSVTVTARNEGGVAVRALTVTLAPTGPGGVAGGLSSSPIDLGPGASARIDLPLSAATPGPVVLGVKAEGVEEVSGRTVAAAAADLSLLVQARAALRAFLTIPSTIAVGATFAATMLVENTGEADALGVAPGTLDAAPDSTGATLVQAGPAPGSADVPGGGRAVFTWSYQLASAGTVRLRGGAAGLDANDGGPVVAAPADSNLGGQLPETAAVAVDPLGDGTAVAAMAALGGLLYVGPSAGGSTFFRLDAETGLDTTLGVEIGVDTGPSPADNIAWRLAPPATTFGAVGCRVNSTECGPNNEAGLGTLATGRLSGADWLAYAPASYLKARFVYLAAQASPPLGFRTVDLGAVLPVTAAMPTSMAFAPGSTPADDRLYVAYSDGTSRKSPYLVALRTAPAGPWLDASSPGDAVELEAAAMPGMGIAYLGTGVPRLDALFQYRGLLHLGSGAGVVRSTVAVPRSHASSPSDWIEATPGAWPEKTSVSGPASAGLRPADLAVPAMAAFGACAAGPCLYLARNVTGDAPAVVGQLWACDPGRTGDPEGCDPGDWTLPAANEAGDRALTQLGDPTNGAVSVLLATPRYLYLGFDNAVTGVQLYRSEVAPASPRDFRGLDGCPAGTAGCQGLGGNGLGIPGLTRFFEARAVTAGGATTVYLAAGDGTAPLRLFALRE
ncbi:MAG: hypothetical protein NDI82_08055 [Anaeromyxobacteraceae bacterium]|nr:hypothetical protein [Anaeromyxobacteraceae bacterium]